MPTLDHCRSSSARLPSFSSLICAIHSLSSRPPHQMSSIVDASSTVAASAATPITAGLILHVDINGTVTPIDSVDREQPHELINLLVAKNTFGHVDGSRWVHHAESYVGSQHPDTDSYYNHIVHRMRAGKRGTFKFTQPGQPGAHLAHLVPLIEAYYSTSPQQPPAAGPLFPSFVRVLHAYPDAKIVFRTFGHDASLIVAAVRGELARRGLKSRQFVGYKLRREGSEYVLEPVEKGTPIKGDEAKLGAFIDAHETDLYIIDDYHWWNSRHRCVEHGKPIFPSARGHTLIALDDNACMALPTAHEGRAHFIRVDPIRALQDEHYFVRAIDDRIQATQRTAATLVNETLHA
jgi:hypothetical protein